ncbi:hypothetical protein [Nonomuraea sp. NPDC048916]
MTRLIDRVRAYLGSSQGKEAVEKAKRMAHDPQNQQKAKRFLDKFRPHHH